MKKSRSTALEDRDNAEAYLLDLVRGKDIGAFSLWIQRDEREWTVSLMSFNDGAKAVGTGSTFAAAMKAITDEPQAEIRTRPRLTVIQGGKCA